MKSAQDKVELNEMRTNSFNVPVDFLFWELERRVQWTVQNVLYKQGNPAQVSVAATRKRNFVLSGILERAASFSPAVHLGTGGKNRRAWNGAPNVPPPPHHHPAEIEGMGT